MRIRKGFRKALGAFGVFMAVLMGFHSTAEANRKANSDRNRANAQKYCDDEMRKGTLQECWVDNNRNCGRGGERIATFDQGGDSYHACVLKKRAAAKKEAEHEAREFCDQMKSRNTFCKVEKGRCDGRDFKELKQFSSPGKDFRACGHSEYYLNTLDNKKRAEDHCARVTQGGNDCKVDNNRGCGPGYEAKAKFDKNPGDSFFACEKNRAQANSDANEKLAKDFCTGVLGGAGNFLKCQVQKHNCGGAGVKIKEFRGRGDNWAVCLEAK